MDGTHERMLEAIGKEIDIFYLCYSLDQSRQLYDRMSVIYRPWLLEQINQISMRFKNGKTLIVKPLSFNTYESLLGFSGCVLLHPDTYKNLLNPKYDYKNVQRMIVECNTRNRPWLDN